MEEEEDDPLMSTLLTDLLPGRRSSQKPSTGGSSSQKPSGKASSSNKSPSKPKHQSPAKGRVVTRRPVTPAKDRERSRSRASSDDDPKDKNNRPRSHVPCFVLQMVSLLLMFIMYVSLYLHRRFHSCADWLLCS